MTMPSDVDGEPSAFDRFADSAHRFVSKAVFFSACVLLVVVWFPTLFFMSVDMSQLIINTVTTIVTFLLVALIENTSRRDSEAMHKKLNAVSAYIVGDCDVDELRDAIGLEKRESS